MSKSVALFREIVNKYHPTFSSQDWLDQFVQHPKIFNIEHLVELTMAHVGGYDFVDAAHYDFSDGTECKTASVALNTTTPNSRNIYRVEISNVVSSGGTVKTGSLRTVLYNPHLDAVRYYFIPGDELMNISINYHPTRKIGRIFATWNIKKDCILKLDRYRVGDFVQLATHPS